MSNHREDNKLGVIIPLANEEKTIDELFSRLLRHLTVKDRVYCVLDNVSKDRTREIILKTAEKDPRVILVWAPENRCVVDAYFRGYKAAFQDNCDWILEMDGGLSHLPEEVPQFTDKMQQGYDFVGGSRFTRGGSHQGRWNRWLISKCGGLLANLLLGTRMTDMCSGFECFNRKAMQMVLQQGVNSRANFFQTEIRYMMHQFNWCEVPINYKNTCFRIGRNSLREAFRILWKLRSESKRKPL